MRFQFVSVGALRALGLGVLLSTIATSASALGQMRITEWMYNGDEFIEFTNVGDASLDLDGWSFDDDSRAPGTVSLSAFGIVAAGQSVILSESDAATFRAAWGLGASVSVIGSNTTNLGRADELNLYDASSSLVDRLTYNDQVIGGPRTQNLSANILAANLGANAANLAVASLSGDAFGSVLSTSAYPGNPGFYVPEPTVATLLGIGVAGLAARRRAVSRSI
jgi:predicted extracellular nuclease